MKQVIIRQITKGKGKGRFQFSIAVNSEVIATSGTYSSEADCRATVEASFPDYQIVAPLSTEFILID